MTTLGFNFTFCPLITAARSRRKCSDGTEH